MKVSTITPDQQSNLNAWRATALERMPYMATILLHMRPLNAHGIPTFACDRYYRLYVNFDAVAEWSADVCADALLHECFHIFAHDGERADEFGVTPQARATWNVASDAANNDDLVAGGCTALLEVGPILPSTLGQPENQTAEFYMRAIMQQDPSPDDSGSDDGDGGGGGSGQTPQAGEGSGGQDQQDGSGAPGDGDEYAGCGSVSGGEAAPCELDPDDDAGGAAPAASAAERRIADVATAADIREYASKHPGTVPGGIVEIADQILTPSEVPWRTVLASAVRRAASMRSGDYDTTYTRRNRRKSTVQLSPGRRVVQPGIYSPTPTLVVVRDTSGSMGAADLASVTSEVDAIARQLGIRGNDLIVIDVDIEVAAARGYKSPSDLREIAGRAGTDMTVGIDAALQMRPMPSAIVVITDGYTPMPTERTSTPIVFCVVGAGAKDPVVLKSIPAWVRVAKVPMPTKMATQPGRAA